MKKFLLSATMAVVATAMVSCGGKGIGSVANLKTGADSAAYSIGYANGVQFAGSLKGVPGDSLDAKLIIAGLADAFMGKEGKISVEDAQVFLQSYFDRAQKEEGEKNLKEGEEFFEKNKSEDGVVTTESGLQYKVDSLGSGIKATSPADTVVVHYKGTTLSGKQFDSSYERNEPATFPLNNVIAGWTEAFQLFPAGSKFTIWVPAALAYGEYGRGSIIRGNQALRFDCELIEVRPASEKK